MILVSSTINCRVKWLITTKLSPNFSSMASYVQVLLLYSLLHISLSDANPPLKPSALVLPIRLDNTTRLFTINKGTQQVPVKFIIDVNGPFLWADCQHLYLSPSYNAPHCESPQCSFANSNINICHTCTSTETPGCHIDACGLFAFNPVTQTTQDSELAEDIFSIESSDGCNSGKVVTVPHFLFACARSELLKGNIPTDTQGFVGLGPNQMSLPTQLATHFQFPPNFALCLGNKGFIFFGIGPKINPNITKFFDYTPLFISPVGEYLVKVRGITIWDDLIPKSLLSLPPDGIYAKISTVIRFTTLQSSIFQAVLKFYVTELKTNEPTIHIVKPVAPYGLCFSTEHVWRDQYGEFVPFVNFVLQTDKVLWRIYGDNTVTRVSPHVLCVAFVDGGVSPSVPIVIGTHQLEDTLLEFDLKEKRLGLTSSLRTWNVTCANVTSVV